MMMNVLGGINMVKDLLIFSDKCSMKEVTKTADEFAKDLRKLRYRTRVSIWKYIKDVQTKDDSAEGTESAGGMADSSGYDNIVS